MKLLTILLQPNKSKQKSPYMKTLRSIYPKIYSKENLQRAFIMAAKGRRDKQQVQLAIADKDAFIDTLYNELKDETYTPGASISFYKYEGAVPKRRYITTTRYFKDQVVHWAVVLQIRDKIINTSYAHSYGCLPGKGIHRGAKTVTRWVQAYRKPGEYIRGKKGDQPIKYALKMDIRKFYQSIPQDRLIMSLCRLTTDKRAIRLLTLIINSHEEGLPIGYLTSQWLSNWYLRSIDSFVKQRLGARHYIRYMDDLLVLEVNKRRLRYIYHCVQDFLKIELGLELNHKSQIFNVADRPVDMLGFRYKKDRTTLRKSILYRAVRACTKYLKRKCPQSAMTLLSYLSWQRHANVYSTFKKNIYERVHIGWVKRLAKCHKIILKPHDPILFNVVITGSTVMS